MAQAHPDWVLGFGDQAWFSRLVQPKMHAWTDSEPLRLLHKEADKKDPEPQAIACYGLLRADTDAMLLRGVVGVGGSSGL